MPIRPIDLQTIIPKAQEHKQSKDSTVNQSDTDQQQSNTKNKQLVNQQHHQVNRMDRRDQMKIRDEGKRRRQGDGAGEKDQEGETGSESESQDPLKLNDSGADDTKESPEKSACDKEKKLKSLQYHKFDMKV